MEKIKILEKRIEEKKRELEKLRRQIAVKKRVLEKLDKLLGRKSTALLDTISHLYVLETGAVSLAEWLAGNCLADLFLKYLRGESRELEDYEWDPSLDTCYYLEGFSKGYWLIEYNLYIL